MPTENRSSNTEMAAKLCPCPFCGQQDAFVEQLDSDASVVICQGRIDKHSACLARGPVGVQQHEGEDQPGHDQAVKEWNKRAAVQPHPEPIAWMVGTAFWWTKEEAERDAAATGLPISGLGPMTGSAPAEQHQGEPVVLPPRREWNGLGNAADNLKAAGWNACLMAVEKLGPLYTHADPNVRWEAVAGEPMRVIERLKAELGEAKGEYDRSANKVADMVAQLAERDALLRELDDAWNSHDGKERFYRLMTKIETLSASAEPSAPTRDPKLIGIVHTPPADCDEP